jgi:hypothetical protein
MLSFAQSSWWVFDLLATKHLANNMWISTVQSNAKCIHSSRTEMLHGFSPTVAMVDVPGPSTADESRPALGCTDKRL